MGRMGLHAGQGHILYDLGATWGVGGCAIQTLINLESDMQTG